MATGKIILGIENAVANIRISDPPSRNALSTEVVRDLHAAVAEAERGARALILTGEGKSFCSGANLASELGPDQIGPDFDAGAGLEQVMNPLMLALRDLRIPWIAAVHGAAAGVGAALALAADLVVASESAYFLQAFCRIGLVPDGGSTFLLTRSVSRVRAMEMMLLGERLPAAQALEWGLINRVVPDSELATAAQGLARALAQGPTKSLGRIRRLAWEAAESDFASTLLRERNAQREAGASPEFREGVTAFLQKRAPRFNQD